MLQWIKTRSRRDLVLAVIVAGGAMLGISAFFGRGLHEVRHVVEHEVRAHAEYEYQSRNSGGVALDQSFDLGSEGRLEVHLGDFDVAVSDGSGDARVVFNVDDDASQDAIEELMYNIEITADDGRLTIRNVDGGRWSHDDDLDVSVEVTVPSGFDVFVQTGDGDVAVGSFSGEVRLQTGDGDVAVGRASGRSLHVQTGDGDVAIAGADSREVRIHTGDGDIAAASLSADAVNVRTGDGDIHIQDLAGALEAATGDGDVQVYVSEFEGIQIRSGDGDITVFAPVGISADVRLSGSDFYIGEAFALPVRLESRSVEGVLNGGGEELSIRVGDGTIRIEERR